MAISLAKNVSLALLFAFIATTYATHCAKPRVRREWRTLSEAERAEWLAAVNVGFGDLKWRSRRSLIPF